MPDQRRPMSTHANTSITLLYLFGSRSPGTRHACCMPRIRLGTPHHHAPLARIGVPHSHTFPTFTPLPRLPLSEGHEGETPQPPSPHRLARQAPLAPTLPAPLRARVAIRPPMHARRCSTHARFVRGRGRRYGSVAGRSCPTLLELLARPHSSLRPSRYVPAGTREHPMRAPLPWRGARMQAHQCMLAHFCTSHLYTFVCLMSPLA